MVLLHWWFFGYGVTGDVFAIVSLQNENSGLLTFMSYCKTFVTVKT